MKRDDAYTLIAVAVIATLCATLDGMTATMTGTTIAMIFARCYQHQEIGQ